MDDETEQNVGLEQGYGLAEHFHEDPHVHGIAMGLREKYDIDDDVYSYLVYGAEVPVTADGTIAGDNDETVAVLAIMQPFLPGGTPMPMEVPLLDGSDPYTIDTEADELDEMDIVAYYDEEQESTVTGMVVDVDPEDEMASLVVGNGDDQEIVSVHTGGETTTVEINGESLAGGFRMANEDDEHEKSWWRIAELEEQIDNNE